MGEVYEAVHVGIGRRVAVKILKSEFACEPSLIQRFRAEARVGSAVDHPGLVQVIDSGSLPDNTSYLVMELLRGVTLSARMREGGVLPEPNVLHIIGQLASIMAALHEQGIIHRDLKPNNVMLVSDPAMPNQERVKLFDLGIAKVRKQTVGPGGETHIMTSAPLGTPAYMAPEQCAGSAEIDQKADVYSLGIMFYEMLCGRQPFIADNVLALMNMQVNQTPPPLRELNREVSEPVGDLVAQLLAKDKHKRPTMKEVQHACQTLNGSAVPSNPAPVPRRQLGVKFALGAGVAASLLAIGGLTFRTPMVRLEIKSTPAGARVVDGKQTLGQTPLNMTAVSAPGARELLLQLPGYHNQIVRIPRDKDTSLEIPLQLEPPVPTPGTGGPTPANPPKAPPADPQDKPWWMKK